MIRTFILAVLLFLSLLCGAQRQMGATFLGGVSKVSIKNKTTLTESYAPSIAMGIYLGKNREVGAIYFFEFLLNNVHGSSSGKESVNSGSLYQYNRLIKEKTHAIYGSLSGNVGFSINKLKLYLGLHPSVLLYSRIKFENFSRRNTSFSSYEGNSETLRIFFKMGMIYDLSKRTAITYNYFLTSPAGSSVVDINQHLFGLRYRFKK